LTTVQASDRPKGAGVLVKAQPVKRASPIRLFAACPFDDVAFIRTPDMEVEVEILDVNEDEARELLSSIDPLVGLGQMQEQLYERLRQNTATSQPEVEAFWQDVARQNEEELAGMRKPIAQTVPEQYMLLVTCQDEKQQLELLQRFQGEGLECKVLLS
jgi:hypothetical protein